MEDLPLFIYLAKKAFTFTLIALVFLGCDQNPGELSYPTKSKAVKNYDEPLFYLNSYRTNAGLVSFAYNDTLSKAAQNHANYEVQNSHSGHNESPSGIGFTGQTPQIRALNAGYNSRFVSENISYSRDIKSSIDSLFTAIYHRFGFLDFSKDEVGFYFAKKGDKQAGVFVMGNSLINDLCKKSDENARVFYKDVCKDKNFKISETEFKSAQNFANEKIVLYPYDGQQNAQTYFSGEHPDPAPECKILSNPISVSFKPNGRRISMQSFELFDGSKRVPKHKTISKENDINAKFNAYQFAYFAQKPFRFSTRYKAIFSYLEDDEQKSIEWSFKTKEPENDYFYIKGGENLAIENDKWYDVFFMPKNCNDLIEKYSYELSSLSNVKIKQVGANHLQIKADAFKNTKINLQSKDIEINFFVIKSNKQNPFSDYKYYGFGLLILALIVGLWRRKS